MNAADISALAKKHPVGTACLLITVACGLALYLRADIITVSQTEYEAKSSEAAKMISNVKNAPGMEEQLAEMNTFGKEVEGRLVKGSQLAVNLQYFYKLEADNGVKMLDLRQGSVPKTPKGLFTPIPFSLSVQGTYPQLMKFLSEVQNGRHFCRVVNASFSKSGGPSSEGGGSSGGQLLNLSLNLELLGTP
jgi:Tfp pilus assembly protein PilO